MGFLQLPLMRARLGLNSFLKINTVKPIRHSFKTKAPAESTQEQEDEDDELNQPIQYSTSPAATWAARNSFSGDTDDAPWFQPLSVGISSATFIIYFLYLREANDIDEIFDRELGDYFDDEALKLKIASGDFQGWRKD